jgi:Putative adhesin
MKNLFMPLLALMVLSCTKLPAQDIKFEETIRKEFTVSPTSSLAIYNIFGGIKIEGYDGDKVIVEIEKTISADTEAKIKEAKNEFKLGFDQKGGELVLYTAAPYDSRPNRQHNNNNNGENQYTVKLNYVLKVPHGMKLHVSTINDGDVEVSDVHGIIEAFNINGKVTLNNVKGLRDVHTVNGDVNVNYSSLPPDSAEYQTLNGDLSITFPANLEADCNLKTNNGEIFTDFENVKNLPSEVKRMVKVKNGQTTHELKKGSAIRIGNGGKKLRFETFNGNIYIKKAD